MMFRRKVNLANQFLIDVFRIEAERDLGVSIEGASTRAGNWSQRIVWTAFAMWYATAIVWYRIQPPLVEPVGATRHLLTVGSCFACIVVVIGIVCLYVQSGTEVSPIPSSSADPQKQKSKSVGIEKQNSISLGAKKQIKSSVRHEEQNSSTSHPEKQKSGLVGPEKWSLKRTRSNGSSDDFIFVEDEKR